MIPERLLGWLVEHGRGLGWALWGLLAALGLGWLTYALVHELTKGRRGDGP